MSHTFRYRAYAFAALALSGSAAHAQVHELGRDLPFHTIALTTGASTTSVDPLNAILTNAHLAGLSNEGISYGATGYFSIDRTMIGFDAGETTFGEEGLNSGRTDAMYSVQVLLTASYAVVSTGRIAVFPTLGAGFGRVNVTLRDRSGGVGGAQPNFADVASTPGFESSLSGDHLLLSFGAGSDYLILRDRRDDFGIVFGVRAGYMFAPNRTSWTRASQRVDGGPDVSASGPFLRFVIGIGGR